MALGDVLADSNNVSALLEVISLAFIIAGFFRWYDSKYSKKTESVKDELCKRISDVEDHLNSRIEHIDRSLSTLENYFHKHMEYHAEHKRNGAVPYE